MVEWLNKEGCRYGAKQTQRKQIVVSKLLIPADIRIIYMILGVWTRGLHVDKKQKCRSVELKKSFCRPVDFRKLPWPMSHSFLIPSRVTKALRGPCRFQVSTTTILQCRTDISWHMTVFNDDTPRPQTILIRRKEKSSNG